MKLFRSPALILTVFLSLPLSALGITPQLEPQGNSLEHGLWWLYHLQYDRARQNFTDYTQSHPEDPAGYFYMTAADWWQLAQELDKPLPEIEKRFEEDFQETVRVSNALLKTDADDKTKALAYLYLGGAQGLKGRWLVAQGHWVKAYFLGKSGHKMLKRSVKIDPTLYDAYMGLGIYDYFTDTLGGTKKVLASFLIRGDRKRGLEQLQLAIEKGQHARVEAQMFLIEIYTWEEHTPEKALPIAQQLHQEFPKSPAMYLAEIIDYYELKQWDEVAKHAQEYLQKSQQETRYYQRAGTLPAWYCLGISAFWGKQDGPTCLKYMDQILKDAPETSRWRTFAYLRTGQVYDVQGDREKALEYYRKVLDRPPFWGSHNEAKNYLKQPFKF